MKLDAILAIILVIVSSVAAYILFGNTPGVKSFTSAFTEPTETNEYTHERSYAEYGDYDCSDFSSQSEAQEFFESEGGPEEDYHNLDANSDGIACESLD